MAQFQYVFLSRGVRGGVINRALLGVVATLACLSSANANLVVNGDFSLGNADFDSGYGYVSYDYTNYTQTSQVVNGQYSVGYHVPPSYFDWYPFQDVSGNGQMMVVNGWDVASDGAVDPAFWEQTVGVHRNTTYDVSFYVAEISSPGNNADVAVDMNGDYLGDGVAPFTQDQWKQYSFTWDSGSDTDVQISLTDLNQYGNENDFAIDDISVTPTVTTSAPGPAGFFAMGVPMAAGFWRRLRR